jgi:hypothetical protein
MSDVTVIKLVPYTEYWKRAGTPVIKESKKMRKSFNQILNEIPKPKRLKRNTKLPYIFDLLYDCKTCADLVHKHLILNYDVRRLLAEN